MQRVVIVSALAVLLGGGVIAWHGVLKPLPPGLSAETPVRTATEIHFLADLTGVDAQGVRRVEQRIFDEILAIIRGARRQITLDLFLFNPYQGRRREDTRALSSELTDALVAHKRAYPEVEITLITDPINTVYGGHPAPHLERLEASGVEIVMTDLDRLRDSNALYSSLWRAFVQPFGEGRPGRFPNPFGGDPVSLRSELRLLNFKANHRKTIVADSSTGWTGLVTSWNPHDGSSAHGNVAVRFDGRAVADLLETERAVAAFSHGSPPSRIVAAVRRDGPVSIRILTEGKIAGALEDAIERTEAGDELALAVFYLSDRGIIERLLEAHSRGVDVRVLLDPNKDAFGIEKNGIPNRPVAAELVRAGISVRWCDTQGEQCHAKMLLRRRDGESTLILGSANFTRRNLRDLNLETDVWLQGPLEEPVMTQAWSHFERVWNNEPGRRYSVDYPVYADESRFKAWVYRMSEASGVGTY